MRESEGKHPLRPPASTWHLRERARLSGGVVAHDRVGRGAPLVLVHGPPSWSYLWRRVAPLLAAEFDVHMFDLLGYGDSEKGGDLSIAAQARMLTELLPEEVAQALGGFFKSA